MEQRCREHNSWDKLVEKAIDAEAKASLQPAFILREMDQRCPEVIAPLILQWPRLKLPALRTLETSHLPPLKMLRLTMSPDLRTFRPPHTYTPCTRTPCDPGRLTRPLTRNLGGKRRSSAAESRVKTQGLPIQLARP